MRLDEFHQHQLASALRMARAEAGLSLYDVPRRMPVSTVRWARIEAGVDAPTEAELDDFRRHVKITPAIAST